MHKALVIIPLILAVTVVAAKAGQDTPADFKIVMTDYKFVPDQITARVGQRVTITLANASTMKLHEFMIGRKVTRGHSQRQTGYAQDFFGGVDITASNIKGVWRLSSGNANVTGVPAKVGPGGTAMGHREMFMIELEASGVATLRFTVPPDRVGEWEIGCFSEAGDHYVKGMKGKLIVVR